MAKKEAAKPRLEDFEVREIVERTLKAQKKADPFILEVNAGKEELRAISEATGESFTEEIEGLGSIDVRAGREAELKGEEPRLNIEWFLSLDPPERRKMVHREHVTMEQIWSKKAKPTVTVRL